jgi:histone acetyltransferase (RNA polymerase elongator complex component)
MGYIKSGGYKDNTNTNINLFPFLNDVAMIRELHVYGNMTPVNKNKTKSKIINNQHQHRGFGRNLILKAEEIAINNDYHKIAVISGVGVRKYYEKFGYQLENNYMIKELDFYDDIEKPVIIMSIIIIIYCIFIILFNWVLPSSKMYF